MAWPEHVGVATDLSAIHSPRLFPLLTKYVAPIRVHHLQEGAVQEALQGSHDHGGATESDSLHRIRHAEGGKVILSWTWLRN